MPFQVIMSITAWLFYTDLVLPFVHYVCMNPVFAQLVRLPALWVERWSCCIHPLNCKPKVQLLFGNLSPQMTYGCLYTKSVCSSSGESVTLRRFIMLKIGYVWDIFLSWMHLQSCIDGFKCTHKRICLMHIIGLAFWIQSVKHFWESCKNAMQSMFFVMLTWYFVEGQGSWAISQKHPLSVLNL